MPADGRWDLIRRLKLTLSLCQFTATNCSEQTGYCELTRQNVR